MLRSLALATLLLFALLSTLLTWGQPASTQRAIAAAQSSVPKGSEIRADNVLTASNVITVTTVDDEINNDGDCSLREAIQAADTNTGIDACPPGNATGDGGDTLYLLAGTYLLTSGQITLTGTITLQGNMTATTALDGNNQSRVLLVAADAIVNLRYLEIRNGLPPACSDCETGVSGGGIANLGTTHIAYSAIHHNKAGSTSDEIAPSGGIGGGIFNKGIMTITNSTVSNNVAGDGSCGRYDENTIVCGQEGSVGGIYSTGTLALINTTVAYNSPGKLFDFEEVYLGRQGGIYATTSITLKNSIIAANVNGDCGNNITSLGHTIIETPNNCVVNGDFFQWGAYLEPLADNGGPTLSHALNVKSPAIDAGDCTDSSGATLLDDQRGAPRPQALGCDIGAIESPYTTTFALITTTLPAIAFDPPPCINIATPCNLTNHPAWDQTAFWSPDGTRIAFERSQAEFVPFGDEAGIYVMNADGTELTLLAPMATDPAWSPDGTQIAYSIMEEDHSEIYLIAATGGTPTNLTNSPITNEAGPIWSPDGSMIAYQSVNANSEIHVMKADGSQSFKVGENLDFAGWSPDSRRLALSRYMGESFYTVAPDGSNVITFTEPGHLNNSPDWSPDGTKLVYACVFTSTLPSIHRLCTADSDGSNRQSFDMQTSVIYDPVWSPDGSMIAFECDFALCTIMSDGSQMRRLTLRGITFLQWSPQGDKILYAELISGEGGVDHYLHFVIEPDGANRRQLHQYASIFGYRGAPAWSPDGSMILYPQNINGPTDLFIRLMR